VKADVPQLIALWPAKPASVGGAEWGRDGAGWVLDAEGMTARVTGSGRHWAATVTLEAPGTFNSATAGRGAVLSAVRVLFAAAASEATSEFSGGF
jgi:hypothetical protein